MREIANSDHGIAVKHQAEILKKQIRSGELRRGGTYVFDEQSGKFRSMTVREVAMSNARSELSSIENSTGKDWRIQLLCRRLRLAEKGL